jgi:hypothetical protein
MKRIVRLTESDLTRIVRRVIKENKWTDEDEKEFKDHEKSLTEYLDDFYSEFDFDYDSAFPEFSSESDKFDDKLMDYITDSKGEGVNPSEAAAMIRKEPWFRRYVKYLR